MKKRQKVNQSLTVPGVRYGLVRKVFGNSEEYLSTKIPVPVMVLRYRVKVLYLFPYDSFSLWQYLEQAEYILASYQLH